LAQDTVIRAPHAATWNMSSLQKVDLEIPLWSKPVSSTAAATEQIGKGSLQIPMWQKPCCPNNMADYVSVVPLHQARATKYLAEQHQMSARLSWSPRSGRWRAQSDGNSEMQSTELQAVVEIRKAPKEHACSSSQSTRAEDNSDQSSSVEESLVADDSSNCNRMHTLVAALREARQSACTRRFALADGTSCVAEDLEGTAVGCATTDQERFTASETAGGSRVEGLVAELRAARVNAASRCAAASAAARKQRATVAAIGRGPFSVTVNTMTGSCHTIGRLFSDMQVCDLCEIIADHFGIPNFAVRLVLDDQVFHMSHVDMSLDMANIAEDSQLMLTKCFGYAKPDVTRLGELEKQWRGELPESFDMP